MAWITKYLGCFAVLVVCALPVRSVDLEKCRGVDIDKTEDHMMDVKECVTAAGATKFEDVTPEKLPIDDKGLPHKENIAKMITEKMPKVVHDDLNKRMSICLDEETSMIDASDESCNTYMPMMMCIHLAFLEECEKP